MSYLTDLYCLCYNTSMKMEQKYINRRRATVAVPLLALSGLLVGNRITDNFNTDCEGEQTVTVDRDDTYWKLAERNVKIDSSTDIRDVVAQMKELNPGLESGSLAVGSVVTIPLECR